MPKKYPYPFSEEELMLGCKRCIENVRGLLAGARILNDNVMTQQYALGLYMYAVEEYGKAILLKNAITGSKKKYHIDRWILGWGKPNDETSSHDKKMRVGFDNLPEDCRIFMRGIKVTEDLTSAKIETEVLTSAKSMTIKRGKLRYDKVSVPKSTGSFFDTSNVNIFDYNLDLKTACFYIDWDRDNWKYDAATIPQHLNKNIKCLEDVLAKHI